MINNFDQLILFLEHNHHEMTSDNFYFGQIVKRNKDWGGPGSTIIKDLYFKSPDSIQKQKDEIIALCELHGARAYINLNVKSFKRCYSFIQKRMADIFDNEDYKSILSMLPSAAGTVSTRDNKFEKLWVIDVDNDDSYPEVAVKQYLYENKINYFSIPTKNGLHLITEPFRLDMCPFASKIRKHNPTLLYYGG